MNLAIIQARMAFRRLPGKTLMKFGKTNILGYLINRVSVSKAIDKIVVATSTNSTDDPIVKFAKENNFLFFRGPENDVLERFFLTAEYYNASTIIRLTADDPFKDSLIIDEAVELLTNSKFDYVSNTLTPSYPEGLDVEVFSFATLKRAHFEAKLARHREHVTPYIWENNSNQFKISQITSKKDLSGWRMTIDYAQDYNCLNKLASAVDVDCNYENLISTIKELKLGCITQPSIIRNEAYNDQLSC